MLPSHSLMGVFLSALAVSSGVPMRHTTVSISNEEWFINGRPTLEGVTWKGSSMQGLLPNSRMVNAIADDNNPGTRHLWDYPDMPWDPERHTNEFVEALADYRAHGLLAITLSLMGGSFCGNDPVLDKSHPQCSDAAQARETLAFTYSGAIRPDYFGADAGRCINRTERDIRYENLSKSIYE